MGMFDEDVEWFRTDRSEAAAAAAELAFEQAHAVRVLFGAGPPSSSAEMLRLQYDALLRAPGCCTPRLRDKLRSWRPF